MPLPDHDEFGPYRAWPQTLVQPVEGRVERLRDHLRRTPVRRPKLTNKKISYTVNLTGHGRANLRVRIERVIDPLPGDMTPRGWLRLLAWAWSPHGAQRWEIGSLGVRSGVAFFLAVVAVPSPVVLVRYDSPAPIRQRPVREYAELLDGVDASGANGAQVFPAVAEVELVDELLVVLEPSQGDSSPVQDALVFVVPVGSTYPDAVSKVELVQVGAVPAREGIIDGSGKLGKGVAAGGCQDPAGSWPQVLASSTDEVNADRQPGATHSRMISGSCRPRVWTNVRSVGPSHQRESVCAGGLNR